MTKPRQPVGRRIGSTALMMFAPPSLWLALLWSQPARSGLPAPVLAYGLAALVIAPGLIGLAMLDLRRRTRAIILPFYLGAMALTLLATLGLSGWLFDRISG